MTIDERNERALAYIERCERRRQRKAARKMRRFNRFMRLATPFAAGICVVGIATMMV